MSAHEKLIWSDGSIPRLIELMERFMPLTIPVVVEKHDEPSMCGAWFDGDQVKVTFHYTMPYGSVQLQILTGYALGVAFERVPVPRTAADRAEFHNALIAVFFELGKINQTVANAFKQICVPQAMEYFDDLAKRQAKADAGELN